MLLEVDLPDSSLEQTHDTMIPDNEMDNKDSQKTTDIQGKQDSVLTLSADDAQEHTLNEDSPKKKHKHKHKHSKKKKAKHLEKEKTTDSTEVDVYEFTDADNFPPPAKIKKKTKKYSSSRSEGTAKEQSQLSSHADVRKRKETQSLKKLTPEETRKHKKGKKNKTSENSCDQKNRSSAASQKKTNDSFTSAKVDCTSTCKLTSQSTDEMNDKGVEDYTMNGEMKKDENSAQTKQPTNLLKPLDDLSSDWSSDDTDTVVKEPIKASYKTKPQKPNLRLEITCSLSSSSWSSEDETEEQDTSVLQTSKEIKKKEKFNKQAKDVQRNEQSNDVGNDSSDISSEEEDNVVKDKDNNTSEDKGSFEREKVNTDNSVQEHDIKTDHDEQEMGDEQVENKSNSVSSKENTITVHVQEEDSMKSDVTLSSGFTKTSSCNSSIEVSNSQTQHPLRIAAQTANVTNMYVMAYNDSNVIEDSDSDEDYVENDILSQQKSISKKSSRVKSLKSNPKLPRSVRKPLRAISPASNLQDLYKKVINSSHTQDDINVNMDCVIGEEEKPFSQDLFEDQGLLIK